MSETVRVAGAGPAGLPDDAHSSTPHELSERLAAERGDHPFLLFRDGDGRQVIVALDGVSRIAIGRGAANDVALEGDRLVSRIHAALERVGAEWTIVDDGLSQNGTFVNGSRVRARLRLVDRDVIRVGHTLLRYRSPDEPSEATGVEFETLRSSDLTLAQRRVLRALIRPLLDGGGLRSPADNQQIADELVMSVETVKSMLKHLFAKFDLSSAPRGDKRLRLAEIALRSDLSSSD
jgi:hypothetical protein